MHASFMRAARRNSENFACLSRDFQRIFAQNLHALERRTRAFSNLNALPIHSRAAATPCSLRSARWPKARIFFMRAARRNSENFAFLSRELCRKMCVISVLDVRLRPMSMHCRLGQYKGLLLHLLRVARPLATVSNPAAKPANRIAGLAGRPGWRGTDI